MSIAWVEFDEVDSTSLYARRLVAREPRPDAPVVVVARTQTSGVGRMGRPWASPDGGLWFTLVWKPARPAAEVVDGLGVRIGVAQTQGLCAAVGEADAPRVRLKWPNDVLIDGMKFCGVLTETVGAGAAMRVLVGVGINLNFDASELPPDLRGNSTSLRSALGRDIDARTLLDDLCRRLGDAIDGPWPDPGVISRANERLHGLHRDYQAVLADGSFETGELVGLDARGIPLVVTHRGVGTLLVRSEDDEVQSAKNNTADGGAAGGAWNSDAGRNSTHRSEEP